MRPVPQNFDPNHFTPYTGEPQIILQDGDVIDLENRSLKILHTPGHSPGHIAILDQRDRYLYTGDLLYTDAPIYALYPSTSPSDLVTSLMKIAELENIARVYGSHHTLGLSPELLKEAGSAAFELKEKGLDQFGTGLHKFSHFSLLF